MTSRTTFKACLFAIGLLAATLAAPAISGAEHREQFGGPRPQQDRGLYKERRFIVQLYVGFLNRQPSGAEVNTWVAKMSVGGSPEEIVRGFMNSDEYFVRQSYIGLLGREPDPEGMETFTRALRRGESRAFVVESIIGSPEFRGRMRP